VVELLFGVLVATTAFGLEGVLWRLGTVVEVDRGFSFRADRVIVDLTTVSSTVGRRTGVTAPLRRLVDRAEMGSADSRRVPNLALADDSLLYVVIPDVCPLRWPF
jgi:hypothetical protein